MKLEPSFNFQPLWLMVLPLFTVPLLVIAFFSIRSVFVIQNGVRIEPPDAPFLLRPQRDPLIVAILPGPKPGLQFMNRSCTVDQFAELLPEAAKTNRTLIIHADRSVPVEMVTRVATAAIGQGLSVNLATASRYHAAPR
jgi:biopolymer transport protein ExbD